LNPSDLNAMMVAASELAMQSRWRETISIAAKVVASAPSQYQTWWLLGQAYDKLGRASDAAHAYAEYYRYAPKRGELRAMREFAARTAGVPFEDTADTEDDDYPTVSFLATINGQKAWVEARNDSGKTLEEVVDAAECFVQSGTPFDAWLHAQKHPELFTSLADTVLSAMAQTQGDVRARTGVERYRDALRRVGANGGVAPFAEMAKVSEADFLAFVTAGDDLQPIVRQLAEASTTFEREAILKKHPEVVTDDRTLVFLRLLGGLQRDSDAREMIQSLFTFIRHARRGTRAKVRSTSARLRETEEQSRAAVDEGSISAIDSALGMWNRITEDGIGDASVTAVMRGALHLRRYDLKGDAADLNIACDTLAKAMRTDPEPESPTLPYQYGIALLRRFEREGTAEDLGQGIGAMRLVLTLVVDGTLVEGAARSVLGAMLMRRAERTGSTSDLNESITAQELAITAEADSKSRAGRFTNLATAYLTRFDMSGIIADLDEAERCCTEALSFEASQADALGAMARMYRSRYRVVADPQLLDRAIEAYRSIITKPVGPLDHALAHNNLSSALRDRYLERDDLSDIDAAVEASRRAVGAAPAGHVQRPMWLENLANNLRCRTIRTGSADDRRDALAAYADALAIAPEGSEVWRTAPSNLGAMIEGDDPDRGLALQELGFARLAGGAGQADVVRAARALGTAQMRRENWSRAGEVLLRGIDALEQLQRTQLSTGAKKAWLAIAGDLHLFAAEALLRAGKVGDAIVAIERGRGRLLTEVLGRDRAALTELERLGDQRLLERYRTAAEQVRMLSAATDHGQNVRDALAAATRSVDSAVDEVRAATGGAAFSRVTTISDILAASEQTKAPIVYLLPLSAFGVVIIVSGATASIRPSILPNLTIAQVNDAVERYMAAYRDVVTSSPEAGWDKWKTALDQTVRWCWEACMRNVVAELGNAPEAVLVPIGGLGRLPLHAATGDEGSALDATVWRYAPNARSLAQFVDPIHADSLLVVAFAQNDVPLPYTAIETAAARRVFSNERALEGQNATVIAVLNEMRNATVLHFACHATAAEDEALASGLQLADGVLSLQALLDARLTSGTIAVLSACETGVIGARLPDEVLSIASGMLQSGASAVVSSLWAVPDVSTAILMSRFYFLWRKEGHRPTAALQAAQRWMRDSPNASIVTFLRANATDRLGVDLIDELERDTSGSTFCHYVHWAAFTYAGC